MVLGSIPGWVAVVIFSSLQSSLSFFYFQNIYSALTQSVLSKKKKKNIYIYQPSHWLPFREWGKMSERTLEGGASRIRLTSSDDSRVDRIACA